jgi:hypothetical protein
MTDFLKEPNPKTQAGRLLAAIRNLGYSPGRMYFTGLTPEQTAKAAALLRDRGFINDKGRLIQRPTAEALRSRPSQQERNAAKRARKTPTTTLRVVTKGGLRGMTRKERNFWRRDNPGQVTWLLEVRR